MARESAVDEAAPLYSVRGPRGVDGEEDVSTRTEGDGGLTGSPIMKVRSEGTRKNSRVDPRKLGSTGQRSLKTLGEIKMEIAWEKLIGPFDRFLKSLLGGENFHQKSLIANMASFPTNATCTNHHNRQRPAQPPGRSVLKALRC